MQERKDLLSKISEIFRKKEPVQPETPDVVPTEQPAAQPVAQTEILTPEWLIREGKRLGQEVTEHALEQRGIIVLPGGGFYIKTNQTAQSESVQDKPTELPVPSKVQAVAEKTHYPKPKEKPRSWENGHSGHHG